jgi:hypothetical protein
VKTFEFCLDIDVIFRLCSEPGGKVNSYNDNEDEIWSAFFKVCSLMLSDTGADPSIYSHFTSISSEIFWIVPDSQFKWSIIAKTLIAFLEKNYLLSTLSILISIPSVDRVCMLIVYEPIAPAKFFIVIRIS